MIIRGINFPNEIIRSIRNNNLVVFVGAGVSIGKPTCLPNFDDLAKQIAKGSGLKKGENEPCDVFLGRLKFNNIDVNKIAGERLSGLHLRPNDLHKYIVSLFNNEQSVKIITTNYDQMIEAAAKNLDKNIHVYNSPALPLGKDFSGIVHIHGNINEPKYMVLTDSDFGHAYMVDGYVSRFLVELFENYTVLFIGYSYNDIIMRYLTRAMVKDGACRRYILTDDVTADWEQLGIEPVLFQPKDFESLYDGVKYLGKITNRKPSEWKLLLDDVSTNPPTDYDLESEVEYCLEDSNKSKLFTEIVHGENWLWWLDKRHVFDNIFSDTANISENDRLWVNWIAKEFVVNSNEVIQKLIFKHENCYNKEFARGILNYIICNPNEISDDKMACLLALFKDDINDEWSLFSFVNLFAERKNYLLAWELFKKFYEYKVTIRQPLLLSDAHEIDYQLDFISDDYEIKNAWKKLSSNFLQVYSKEILEFGRNKILDIHDRYVMLGLANAESEPCEMMNLPIENGNGRVYSNNILILLADFMQAAAEKLQKDKSVYLQEFVDECLSSRSVLLKKIALKMLRETNIFTANEKVDILLENFDLYSVIYKEQIFLLVDKIFDQVTKKNENKIWDIIEKGGNSGDEEIDAYTKFNWCNWLIKNRKNNRGDKIINNIRKKYSYFKPRKNPELNIEYSEGISEDESPYTEKELLDMNVDELIKLLQEYQGKEFDGPNRYGLLDTFSNCIKNNYDWIYNIIPKLKENFNVDSDIWQYIYQKVIFSELKANQLYEILLILSDKIYINRYFNLISRLMEKIIETSEKEEIRKYENKIWDVSHYILNNKLVDNNEYEKNIISLCLNSSSGLCISTLIRLYASCNENEGKRYLLLFEKLLNENRQDKRQIICVFAGQFNFFFNRNKKWCSENIFPYLSSENDDEFSAAWEGYLLYSGRLYYAETSIIQNMYLNAIGKLNLLGSSARQRFIELYSVLIVRNIENPIDNYVTKLLKCGNNEDYCTFSNSIKRILESMTEREIDSLWDNWLGQYIENRVNNIPIPFDKKELIYVAEWIFNLETRKDVFVSKITNVKISANDCSMLLLKLKKREWYKANTKETINILLWILDADDISNYIFNEISQIMNMLEKEGVDCREVHEKLISKGRVV